MTNPAHPGPAGFTAGIDAGIDLSILDEAAEWLMRLHSGDATDADRQACLRWQATSPQHAHAWKRAQALLERLGGLPPELSMPVLTRNRSPARRAFVARLAACLLIAPAGYGAWRAIESEQWTADHRTAPGEQRDVRLADGTLVKLDTASAFDVRYDAHQRFLRLREGEILVQTAPDNAPVARPLRVGTAQGVLEALGTRFTVRLAGNRTYVAVTQGAVQITPSRSLDLTASPAASTAPRILSVNQQTWLSDTSVATPVPLDEAATAWTRGLLLADDTPLAEFATAMARYRRGPVRCDPAVASLRVSGAFPVTDIERTLTMLVSTYPVTVNRHFGGWWISITPRAVV